MAGSRLDELEVAIEEWIAQARPFRRAFDERGGMLGTSVFNVSGEGHRAMEAWALAFGPVSRWGIEGAAGIGRHTAMFLARRGGPATTAAQTSARS